MTSAFPLVIQDIFGSYHNIFTSKKENNCIMFPLDHGCRPRSKQLTLLVKGACAPQLLSVGCDNFFYTIQNNVNKDILNIPNSLVIFYEILVNGSVPVLVHPGMSVNGSVPVLVHPGRLVYGLY